MNTHTFTPAQAAHALEVVMTLMKERRFFLYRHDSRSIDRDPKHGLDPKVFGPAIELDEKIRALYARTTREAEGTILDGERDLGLTAPDLSDNKRLVQCNRYTGGLDICRVYPLAAFLEFAPRTRMELEGQETKRLMGDHTARALRELKDEALKNTVLIWNELQSLKAQSDKGCVVLLHTRFAPSQGYREDDFMEGKTADIKLFPHAMGYLFYQYSKRRRIVQHNHVVFNTARSSHVNVEHLNNGELSLGFNKHGGYSCQVYFPIVL